MQKKKTTKILSDDASIFSVFCSIADDGVRYSDFQNKSIHCTSVRGPSQKEEEKKN